MSLSSTASPLPFWRTLVCRLYRTSLGLYPQSFRDEFAQEMSAIFEEALDAQLQGRWISLLSFLGRELVETPLCALRHRLKITLTGIINSVEVIFVYALGFFLLGWMNILSTGLFQDQFRNLNVGLLSGLIIGGLSGLTIATILVPQKKTLFTVGGMIGSLTLAISAGRTIAVFIIIAGISLRNWRDLYRLSGYALWLFAVGLFVNRLSAAFVQRFMFNSHTQLFSQTGAPMVLVPFLLTGISLGIVLSGVAPKTVTEKA